MSLSIPGLSTLYAILKRDIEVRNQRLEYRRELAEQLHQNCEKWSQLLVATFDQAVVRWAREGRQAAEKEIMDFQADFLALDYSSLRENSPIIMHLHNDERFREFAEACYAFYDSALEVKSIAYGNILSREGGLVDAQDTDVVTMTRLWKDRVKRMLESVRYEWRKVQTLEIQ